MYSREEMEQAGISCTQLTPQTASAMIRQLLASEERLREALYNLEKASSEVAKYGAQTGPQWSRLAVASLIARTALKGTSQ